MHLLYLDESGIAGSDAYFVLAGAAVFERQSYWIGQELDKVQREFFPDIDDPITFHASSIRVGKEPPWCSLPQAQRYSLLDKVYAAIAYSRVTLFGVAVERAWLVAHDEPEDEYEHAFEDIVQRFDYYLKRLYKDEGEPQRGLVIIAESNYRSRIETLAKTFRSQGTRWGELRNLAEIPLFTQARNSRMLQVADFCSNALFGRYERGQTRQFDILASKFDAVDGVIHGLVHLTTKHHKCYCPACLTRSFK